MGNDHIASSREVCGHVLISINLQTSSVVLDFELEPSKGVVAISELDRHLQLALSAPASSWPGRPPFGRPDWALPTADWGDATPAFGAVADAAPERLRGTAFGLFDVVVGLATFTASAGAGLIWTFTAAAGWSRSQRVVSDRSAIAVDRHDRAGRMRSDVARGRRRARQRQHQPFHGGEPDHPGLGGELEADRDLSVRLVAAGATARPLSPARGSERGGKADAAEQHCENAANCCN